MNVLPQTKRTLAYSSLLLLATVIWGFAFVAQRQGGDLLGPYTFTSVRFLMAAAVLSVVVIIRRKKVKSDPKLLWTGGAICGSLLCLAVNFQQLGLSYGVSVGKTGFITAMYIVLVPIVAFILFRKKSGWNVWVGIAIAIVSLYLLCITDSFSVHLEDLIVLGCALAFSFQILMVDKYVTKVDPIEFSCVEFLVCSVVGAIPMLALEIVGKGGAWVSGFTSWDAWGALLYAGCVSGGVGYTLQVLGQKGTPPTLASLVMSLESVFAALAGWMLLNQTLSTREIIGCALMFLAIIVAQIPLRRKEKGLEAQVEQTPKEP